MNKIKTGYYVSTGLLTLMLSLSVGMYIFKHAEIADVFVKLGYPAYLVYPLAIAKILGVLAIWSRKSLTLTYMAYAGFFYNFVLAFFAHVAINDGEFFGALIAMVLLVSSYTTQRKHFSE